MEILTTKEACTFLKVSDRTLRRWIKEGLPHTQIKRGFKLLFSRRKLLDWLEENSEPTSVHVKFEKLKLIRRK